MKIKLLTSVKGKTYKNKPTKYHIFHDGDTYCRMLSTGGLKYKTITEEVSQKYYELLDANEEICRMCSDKNKRYDYQEKTCRQHDLAFTKMMGERHKTLLEEEKQLSRIDKAEFDTLSGG